MKKIKLFGFYIIILIIISNFNQLKSQMPNDPAFMVNCVLCENQNPSQIPYSGGCNHTSTFYNENSFFMINSTSTTKIINLNFIFVQKTDGSGNFSENSGEDQEVINDLINSLNYDIQNLNTAACGGTNSNAKIQFQVTKYYVKDTYLWNNDNDNNSYKCPSSSNWYLKNKALEFDQINPKGINIFFTCGQTAYNANVVNHEQEYKGFKYACSLWPSLNFEDGSYIHMPDVFIKYKWMKEWATVKYNQPWNIVYGWFNNTVSRVIFHELGHSFDLTHTTECSNVMDPSGPANRDYLNDSQLYIMHRTCSITNVRKFVNEFTTLDQDLVINSQKKLDFDTRIYKNIVIQSGGELTISCKLLMPALGKIIVNKGGKLIIDNGTITNSLSDKWQGIIVYGDPTQPQTNLAAHGIVETKNGAIIENAVCGIGNHMFFQILHNSGGIVKCENTSFNNCDTGIRLSPYEYENEGYVNNCSFNNSEYGKWGIYLNQVNGFEIKGSTFNGLQRGIYAFDSKIAVKQSNIFRNISEAGILSLAKSPRAASLEVTDHNQFIGCYYGISISGNTGNAIQDISENYFENCYWAVDIDGENNYNVKDNRVNNCNYGVLSWASGDFVNDVKCNEMLYTKYGNIYMLFRNRYSSFLGNNFLESGSGPDKFDFRLATGNVAMEQGDKYHPAMNYFWSTDDIETENSESFDYYKPNPPVVRTDPQNPGNYTEQNSLTDDQQNCGTPPVPVVTDVQISNLKDD